MPELIEQMYCSQQIVIPPKFPYILKRYCKAAIKTQPYDLLRWSYEYFTALAEHRAPPVKLRLEYPIYSTEGGLTRGCLKVLANQLSGMTLVPLISVRQAWRGFCLDITELHKILCLCEVYLREEAVPLLHFIAVAGGLLTKTLTHTMILLCETLTHEPDGGSAAIPVKDFLQMYRFIAAMDASKDVKYLNGYREGESPKESVSTLEEEELQTSQILSEVETISDEYWGETKNLHKLNLINDLVPHSARLSMKLNMPLLGKIERSPSIERAGQIERENYMRERKGRASTSEEVEQKLRDMSASHVTTDMDKKDKKEEKVEKKKEGVEVIVFDEDDNEIPYEIYGEPQIQDEEVTEEHSNIFGAEDLKDEEKNEDVDKIKQFVKDCYDSRLDRIADLEATFQEIAVIVDRFKSANYDLGMVAGRQMSTTSGEFIVAQVEKDIMDYINEQIAILPDPDLKKKKAKPEEVAMIKELLDNFVDEHMDVIAPEIEEVEEEEHPIPEITVVHAVPGIGPAVDEDIIHEVERYMLEVCKVQANTIMPRNIRHFLCPPLEKYEEHDFDNQSKELIATGGLISD